MKTRSQRPRRRSRRIHKLDPYRQKESVPLEELPGSLRWKGQSWRHYLLSKWKAEGRPLTGWRLALANGIAKSLTLYPRDSSWSRRMNGAKGGKASVRSPRHFPIEKARLIRSRKAALRRLKKLEQQERERNPFALPRRKPGRLLPL